MIPYVTLYQLRAELGLGADETGDDALLARHLRSGSRWIDSWTGRRFDVRRETRRADGGYVDLLLDDDLLAVIGLLNGDGSVVDPAGLLYRPANDTPRWALLAADRSPWLASPAGIVLAAVAIDGLWGYHTHYADAWADTLDQVANAPLAAGGTSLTVANADGVAVDSDEPRLQAGNLIRFGALAASEMALVVSADYVANTAVIARGQNGSTASEQIAGTKIYVFRPWENAARALMRLATWSYRLKDVTFYERITMLGSTQKVAPGGIPDDVIEMLPGPRLVVR